MKKALTAADVLERRDRRNRTVLIIITALKSLFALQTLGLFAGAAIYTSDSNAFAILLGLLALVFATVSYLFSLICLILNRFAVKTFPKPWNIISIVSIICLVLVISAGTLTEGYESTWFIAVFTGCLILHAVPTVLEIIYLNRYIYNRRKLKK